MPARIAPRTTVPDVVGLPFHVGRDVATRARVVLANPDPDGPPIASLAWPGLSSIVRQDPAPGSLIYEWDSVSIEVTTHGDSPDREPTTPRHAPPGDSARATPQLDAYVDLTGER